jgi:SagB-type dehydrogenase family enzyme
MYIQNSKRVFFPPPQLEGEISLEQAINGRRSVRNFASQPISHAQLGQILWAANGNNSSGSRTIPNAGETHPLELFVVCGHNSVERTNEGVYRYDNNTHSMMLGQPGDLRSELSQSAAGQSFLEQAPAIIVICAVYERTAQKYGSRSERYVHMEVGHAGQNVYLQAAVVGLSTVAVAAFDDKDVQKVLRLDKQYHPLYIMPLGYISE